MAEVQKVRGGEKGGLASRTCLVLVPRSTKENQKLAKLPRSAKETRKWQKIPKSTSKYQQYQKAPTITKKYQKRTRKCQKVPKISTKYQQTKKTIEIVFRDDHMTAASCHCKSYKTFSLEEDTFSLKAQYPI